MMNRICVILTTAAALICLLVFVTGDNSQAIEDVCPQTQSVSEDRIQIVVKDDGGMPYGVNIAVGIVLIGGAVAVCGFCVRELRKERFSPFDK
ncbi:MAG: hypothetical protein IKP78_07635 [Ruminococcus sp.]|nr:hypothetical protein [Ruminococcus sp.]